MRFSPTFSILRKELKALGGLWIAMIMLCLIIQMSLMMTAEFRITEIHNITAALFGASLILAALYAAGTTGVLFAMEHEAGTFGLLRRLPFSPRRIFFSKLLWPLASVIAFWAVAWPASRLFTSSFPSLSETGMLWALWGTAAIETFAWGTFFSLRSRRPLVAAFLGLAMTGLFAYIATIFYINLFGNPTHTVGGAYAVAWPARLLVASAVLAVDVLLGLQWFDASKTLETEADDATGVAKAAAWSDRWQTGFFGKTGTFMSLVWQHWRQSRGLIGCLALGFVPLAVYSVTSSYGSDRDFWTTIVAAIAIAAFPIGASLLFMPDQRRRSYRFLAHHGASPSTVWWSRQCLGAVLMTIGAVGFVFLLFILARFAHQGDADAPDARETLIFLGAVFLGAIFIAYASGQFVSLVVRSPVIAGVVGCAVTCVLLAWMAFTQAYLISEADMLTGKADRERSVLLQSVAAFLLVLAPILIAMVVASRLHVKDWLSDHVTRRSHLRWAGILFASLVIVYACLPIMRFANAPAYTDPGFSVTEFERREEGPRVKEAVELIGRVRQSGADVDDDVTLDEDLVKDLIEFGRRDPLTVGIAPAQYTDNPLYLRPMTLLYDRLWKEGRRLDAIAVLRAQMKLASSEASRWAGLDVFGLSRLVDLAHEDDLQKKELEAALELVQSLTPRSLDPSEEVKTVYVRLRTTLGVVDAQYGAQWPRRLVLTVAPWEKSVFIRFLNARSRSALEQIQCRVTKLSKLNGFDDTDCDSRDDYWWAAAEYAHFGSYPDEWNFWWGGYTTRTERNRRAILLLLLLRKWQMEHDGQLPQTLDSLVGKELPVVPVNPEGSKGGQPFTLNRDGRPFPFKFEDRNVSRDFVPANTPYLTCVDDNPQWFFDIQGGRPGLPEEIQGNLPERANLKKTAILSGPAWPVWVPGQKPVPETPTEDE